MSHQFSASVDGARRFDLQSTRFYAPYFCLAAIQWRVWLPVRPVPFRPRVAVVANLSNDDSSGNRSGGTLAVRSKTLLRKAIAIDAFESLFEEEFMASCGIRQWMVRITCVLADLHCLIGVEQLNTVQADVQQHKVVIERDEWGVAHIHGKTNSDVFFGMGYAQAEDYFWQLEDTCLRSIGRYAEVAGEAGLSNDILNRSFEIVRKSQADFSRLKPEFQAMAINYVAGINRYLETHPDVKPRLLSHFEPWFVLTMERQMILDFLYRRAHVKRPASRRSDEIAVNPSKAEAATLSQYSWDYPSQQPAGFAAEVHAAIGSNAWAISGKKTASGAAMLFINPHQPWYGMGQFQETHVRSDEGLNFSGACFYGNPFPTIGHNQYLGWTYTVNDPDVADAWRVVFDDETRPLHYRYGQQYREATQWSETLKVKQKDDMVSKEVTFRKTHQGPVVSRESENTYLVVQVAGLFDLNRAAQCWGMVTAKNFQEWRRAMEYCAVPMFNVVYADRDGNIFYAYNGTIPVRNPQFDWTRPVDGSNPQTDWTGIHTFDQLPQVLNPQSGYVQSCNSSPFTTTENPADNPRTEDFPKYMLEDRQVDMRRAKLSRMLLSTATGLTLDRLRELAYDTRFYWAMTEIPRLQQEFERLEMQNPELARDVSPYFLHLSNWDFRSSIDSTQATLCVAWYEELYGFGYPAETLKRDYADDRVTWFAALKLAATKLKSLHGDWKYPWGKAHRLQRIPNQPDVQEAGVRLNGTEFSLPIEGAPGPLGIIHTVYSTPEIPFIRPQRYAVVGASYMSVVEFSAAVPSWSVMPFGASGRRKSPHYFDQAKLYSTKQFKFAWFTPEETSAHCRTRIQLDY